ncbi:MAG: arginine--tRNA ligase, partial [Gammaproteobacteria bacterium]
MKNHLRTLVTDALTALAEDGAWEIPGDLSVPVERTRDREHGDFATPVTLGLARVARCSPRDLAEKLVAQLPLSPQVERVEIAGPGFINFFLSDTAYQQLAADIVEQGESFGRLQQENAPRVQVEFVSANPTGPLHVGHGRGAAYGAAVADLLEATGCQVEREYYVNDAGRQMDILVTSVWLRYLELCGEEISFPDNGYQGDYIWDIAASVHRQWDEALRLGWGELVGACAQVSD